MNEFVRQHENNEKLISFQTMMGNQMELLVPGRTLLMSGEAIKVSSLETRLSISTMRSVSLVAQFIKISNGFCSSPQVSLCI